MRGINDNFICNLNPYERVGIAHNEALKHFEGLNFRNQLETGYRLFSTFVSGRYGYSRNEIIGWSEVQSSFNDLLVDPYTYFHNLGRNYAASEAAIFAKLEDILLNAPNVRVFLNKIDKLVRKVLVLKDVSRENLGKLLGMIAIAKHSVLFWDARVRGGVFGGTPSQRRNGKFWADVGGFVVGAVIGIFHGGDPIGSGLSVASAASDAHSS